MKKINQLKTGVREEEIIQEGMFYCPYGRENYQCFFLWLQKRTLQEKMEWYRKLTSKDKRELVRCHYNCRSGQSMKITHLKEEQHN